MEMSKFEFTNGRALAGLTAMLALCAGLSHTAFAQTTTIQSNSPGCTTTSYNTDSNRIHSFVCTQPQVPGTIQFTTNTFASQLTNSTGNYVSVSRTGGTLGALSGTVSATGGGCTVNGGAVAFADGSSVAQQVSITTPGASGSCNFTLTPGAGTTAGSPTSATMQVVNPNSPGAVAFTSSGVTAVEGASAVAIGIARTGGGSQAPAVDVAVTASGSAVVGTNYTITGLVAPGSAVPTGGNCPSSAGVLGCASIGLGATVPATGVSLTAPVNEATPPAPTLTFTMSIVNATTPAVTLGAQATLAVTINDPPPGPPPGCTVEDAHTQLGGNPPLPVTSLAANGMIAFRIAHTLLDGRFVGAYQPTTGISVSISNLPCDFGTPVTQSLSGCHINMPGNNPTQVLVRVSTANGYMTCAKPTPTAEGHLYVNLRWSGFTNFGQPITNFCTNAGFSSCNFQFRRDP
jgi:hypothetical protein